jgi:hypothetical protein
MQLIVLALRGEGHGGDHHAFILVLLPKHSVREEAEGMPETDAEDEEDAN